jgi:hypothetical protein
LACNDDALRRLPANLKLGWQNTAWLEAPLAPIEAPLAPISEDGD